MVYGPFKAGLLMFVKPQEQKLRDRDGRIVLRYHLFLALGIRIVANQGANVIERGILELGRIFC